MCQSLPMEIVNERAVDIFKFLSSAPNSHLRLKTEKSNGKTAQASHNFFSRVSPLISIYLLQVGMRKRRRGGRR